MVDVICIGNSAVDVPVFPINESVLHTDSYPVDKIIPVIGGSATNVSTIITRLGHRVALMAHIGQDMFGEMIIKHCKEVGIDVNSVIQDTCVYTPLSIGLVKEDGERNFIVSKSSGTFHLSLEDIDFSRFQGAKLLTIASIFINPLLDNDALTAIFQKARENNMIVCADIMKSRDGKSLDDIRSSLSFVDYFFPNYEEASWLTGKLDLNDIADVLLSCGIKTVVIKNGKKGCFIKTKEDTYTIPTYDKAKRVDTIGAGDNFVAGFITALLDGAHLEVCGKFANATASVSVESVGATTGVKGRAQVLDMMA